MPPDDTTKPVGENAPSAIAENDTREERGQAPDLGTASRGWAAQAIDSAKDKNFFENAQKASVTEVMHFGSLQYLEQNKATHTVLSLRLGLPLPAPHSGTVGASPGGQDLSALIQAIQANQNSLGQFLGNISDKLDKLLAMAPAAKAA
jgi:hypothetical protein